MDVLILDLTHGGDLLARRYRDQGHEVTAVDVYGLCSDAELRSLDDEGIEALRAAPPREFELLVSPVHCPDSFIRDASFRRRSSFHQAVGELIDDDRFRIEVTGVKGKTSSCHLIAHMLAADGRSVLLHSSSGRELFRNGTRRTLQKEVSINPVSLLSLPEDDVDVVVAEMSLGGSGEADIGIITDRDADYAIAAGTRSAREAKASMIGRAGRTLLPLGHRVPDGVRADMVECHGGRVKMGRKARLGEGQRLTLRLGDEVDVTLQGCYLGAAYRGAIEVAVAAALMAGVDESAIVGHLESFKGVPGRGEVRLNGDGHYLLERNPGISAASIAHQLESLEPGGGSAVLVPADRKVCDALDMEAIRRSMDAWGMRLTVDHDALGLDPSLLAERYGASVVLQKEAYR